MRSFVQVLTTPTADTPGTTLLLHFDNKRYLVGSMAEGTQRASVQMGARLLKVSQCFITGRTEWSNIGGIIGMILTLADGSSLSHASFLEDALNKARSKAKRMGWLDDEEKMRQLEDEARNESKGNSLTIFGPPNLNHTLATARRFVFRKGMPVDVHEIQEEAGNREGDEEWAPYWADDNIKVWPLSISPTPSADGPSMNGNGTTRSRKRTIDEVYEGRPPTEDELSQRERDSLTTKAVVSEMFDSSWRLDTLYETPLSQVNLPASIFVRNAETNKIERYRGPLPGGHEELSDPDLPVLVRRPWPGALIESLPYTEPAKEAISYIIRGHTQRGKFRPDRAKALKVAMGHKWSQLTAGQNVENDDGETITPDMVLGESKVGGGFAVVDLPDPSYVESLIHRPEWQQSNIMAGVGAIFWICGRGVAADQRVHGFMRQFSHLEHIVSSPDYCPNHIALDSVAASTLRLKKIDPARYNVPHHDEAGTGVSARPLPDAGVYVAERGQVVQLEPSLQYQVDQVVKPLSLEQVGKEMSEDVLSEAAKAQEAIKADEERALEWANSIPDPDAEIVTLGTGSALPSKYRNVSATLLRLPGWGCVLFDAGENTLGQLKRVFPPEELKQILHDLRVIFISHMHADHHLGTASVIRAWYNEVHDARPLPSPPSSTDVRDFFVDQKRLAVISEPAMQQWLAEYASVEDYGFSRIAPLQVSASFPSKGQQSRLRWFTLPSELAALPTEEARLKHVDDSIVPPALIGLKDVQAVEVRHCHGAHAVSMTFPSGFKASYSGDCRPSKSFARIGRGSTVCIHEATFDDELQGDAEAKNHSTMSEALSVAQAMNAKTCVLTHFSQRYQKMPIFEHAVDTDEEPLDLESSPAGSEADEADANAQEPPGPAIESLPMDAGVTLPDQTAVNGMGRQYELPSKLAPPSSSARNDGTDAAAASATDDASTLKFRLKSDMKVCVAFDYMRVKVGEMAQMEKFTPAMVKLFAEDEDKEAAKKAKSLELEESKKEKKKGKKGKKEK